MRGPSKYGWNLSANKTATGETRNPNLTLHLWEGPGPHLWAGPVVRRGLVSLGWAGVRGLAVSHFQDGFGLGPWGRRIQRPILRVLAVGALEARRGAGLGRVSGQRGQPLPFEVRGVGDGQRLRAALGETARSVVTTLLLVSGFKPLPLGQRRVPLTLAWNKGLIKSKAR